MILINMDFIEISVYFLVILFKGGVFNIKIIENDLRIDKFVFK